MSKKPKDVDGNKASTQPTPPTTPFYTLARVNGGWQTLKLTFDGTTYNIEPIGNPDMFAIAREVFRIEVGSNLFNSGS